MDHQFLTALDVAKILKISKALAYRLIAEGNLQSIKFGKTVRVKLEDLNTFIELHKSVDEPHHDSFRTGKAKA